MKCCLLDAAGIKCYKAGDRVDIVGVNRGVINNIPATLEFKDCVVLPAGAIQLPTPGGAAFMPLY